jgi:hypothetical protein
MLSATGKGAGSEEVQAFLDANLTSNVKAVLSAIRHLLVTEAHRLESTMWVVLDAALQRAKGNKLKWGGAQLVLEGDFLQLTNTTPLFAQADFNASFKVIYLHQQWRSDGELQTLLGTLAMSCAARPIAVHEAEALRSLQRPLPRALAAKAVHLFGRVDPCRLFNEEGNRQLPGQVVTYQGTDSLGATETRQHSACEAALDAGTNLSSAPLHLKVRSSAEGPSRARVP